MDAEGRAEQEPDDDGCRAQNERQVRSQCAALLTIQTCKQRDSDEGIDGVGDEHHGDDGGKLRGQKQSQQDEHGDRELGSEKLLLFCCIFVDHTGVDVVRDADGRGQERRVCGGKNGRDDGCDVNQRHNRRHIQIDHCADDGVADGGVLQQHVAGQTDDGDEDAEAERLADDEHPDAALGVTRGGNRVDTRDVA